MILDIEDMSVFISEFNRLALTLLGCVFLSAGCKNKSTSTELPDATITKVEIANEHVTSNYATKFEVVLQDSLEKDQRIAWRFQQPDGSYSDSLTGTTTFFWVAPDQPGQYKHNLWVETEEGEVISNVHSITVSVIPWQPPPAENTLSGKLVFSAQTGVRAGRK